MVFFVNTFPCVDVTFDVVDANDQTKRVSVTLPEVQKSSSAQTFSYYVAEDGRIFSDGDLTEEETCGL